MRAKSWGREASWSADDNESRLRVMKDDNKLELTLLHLLQHAENYHGDALT
jgi:hypothetical protein